MPGHETAFVPRENVPLHPFTTLGVGGPARWFARANRCDEVAAIQRWCADREVPLFVLGGGSNLVISDEGFQGLILSMAVTGVTISSLPDSTIVTAGAGEQWDALVEACVARGLTGIECLSGIPGTVGGTPIQNVGAYGQEVADAITRVVVLDRPTCEFAELSAPECEFSYRGSRFKGSDAGRFIVCGVTFRLSVATSTPSYPDVITELERRRVVHATPRDLREAVLAIRRRKGMVLDADDTDTRSVGSFFMNPKVTAADRDRIAGLVKDKVPQFAVDERRIKIPAAWLIERSGLHKGDGERTVGLSTKHPLAIVNRGGARARDVLRFAVRVKRAVIDWCGVWLRPEPVFVGFGADDDVEFLQKAQG